MATTSAALNFMDPANKEHVLDVLRTEVAETFDLISDPEIWLAPTACTGWQVRDIVGHLVDATEGYLPNFAIARGGAGTPPEALGLRVMAERADENARSFRKVPREEMIERLQEAYGQAMTYFESCSDDDWTGLMVHHPYMGPIPAMFYPMFQLIDHVVHTWDIREGVGRPHAIAAGAADLIVPVIFILWQATADTSGVGTPFSIGVRTSGPNGGDTRLDVSNEGVQFAPASIDDCPAILEFDPATLMLTAYGRINGGTVRGDRRLAGDFRSLIFAI